MITTWKYLHIQKAKNIGNTTQKGINESGFTNAKKEKSEHKKSKEL